ncbi:MAG: ABC transporter ATP-binding protein [Candidatus Marsarchaeota archaeon]|nr:ABC transporter ATP-binding protein [Candidatus Marsarchaeota archaeon]
MKQKSKESVINVNHVRKVYRSKEMEYIAIKDISLEITRGEFVTVLGPSGSGKTTLLDVIGTLDTPTSGKVLIEGVDTSEMNDGQLSVLRNEKIGFIFQSYNLVPYLNVIENVMLPLMVNGNSDDEHRKLATLLLEEVGLSGKLGKKPTELSGGEQQRVAIVRALVNKPHILLADEPTGNLDSKTSDEVINLLARMSKENDTTILMVTHDPDLAKLSDRCVYMRDGLVEKEIKVRK